MKKKSLLFFIAAGVSFAVCAIDYIWTGGAGDGLWTSPGNWNQNSGYPNDADAEVTFPKAATVSLDTGVQTDIAYINVTAGDVVLTATEGSSLKINWVGHNNPSGKTGNRGIMVSKGASLDVGVPLAEMSGRFDRQGEGALTIRDIAVRKTNSANMYFFNGTNSFVGTASLTLPAASATFGVGTPYGPMPVFIRDQAAWDVTAISTSASTDGAPWVDIVQDGEETSVSVKNGIELFCSVKNGVSHDDVQRYTLKRGTLSAMGIELRSANPTNIQYVQEGGTSTFSKVTLSSGSAALHGGVMNFTGANADFSLGSGTTFEISGGTLVWPRTFNPSGWPQFRYAGRFGVAVPSGSNFEWDWSRAHVAPGSVFVHAGAGTLKFIRAISTEGVGLELGDGKTVEIDSHCTVSAPRGSTEPWNVTLDNGSILKLNTGLARLGTPLDLTVNGTGKVFFNNCRSAVVAHKLTVDGEEMAKGRYYVNKGHSFVGGTSGYYGSSIIVPHVWTGAGGDDLWSNPANWDDNIVPNGTMMCADISRATAITLNENIVLSCLIAMPNGAERKVTVTGSGSVTIDGPDSSGYDCAFFIPQDCELVLDVDFKRTLANTMALQGGGRLTVKKAYPGCTSGVQPMLAVDGEVSFAGTTAITKGSGYDFLSAWTYDAGTSHLFIEDGATVTADRFQVTKSGYTMPDDFRQRGGTTVFNAFYLGNYNSGSTSRGTLVYYLDSGSMTVNGPIHLGRCLGSTDANRYPGGSFEMAGGTLACGGFNGGFNQNYVRLHGGTLQLNGNLTAVFDNPQKIAGTNRNDITYYLGGVTIRPMGSVCTLSSGNAYLTGKNGDTVFDLAEANFKFSSGNTVSGPGGIVVMGGDASELQVETALTFTGAITIKSGNLICWSKSTINGPRALVVENASSKAHFESGVAGVLDRVVLVSTANLTFGSGKRLTTARLVVAGEEYAAGSYAFGKGTVVVTGSTPASWVVDGAGDLSWFADGTTTTVAEATTLSSLVYSPVAAGETNTLAGAALTFADGANIHVEKDDTLVIGNDVVLAGKVAKTGEGEVVFNGGVTCSGAPGAENDTGWLTVTEGGATFDGAVTGVRLITCGTKTPPVITLNEHCTVSNWAIVLTAWSEGGAVAKAMGETRQNGATVDMSAGVFEALRTNTPTRDLYPLSRPNGGVGRYVLNSGTFRSSDDWKFSFFESAEEVGTFAFVQNGGTFFAMNSLFFARTLKNATIDLSYTLNDGRVEFNANVSGTHRKYDSINFNGGTAVFKLGNGANFAERQFFTVSVGGDTTFELENTARSIRFPNDWTGDGTITFNGGNYSFSGGLDVGGLNIAAGVVTLGRNTALAATGDTALTVSKTAALNLDYDGEMPFKTLKVGSHGRAAGVYSATQGPAAVRNVLHGNGKLLILEGSAPGSVLSIR